MTATGKVTFPTPWLCLEYWASLSRPCWSPGWVALATLLPVGLSDVQGSHETLEKTIHHVSCLHVPTCRESVPAAYTHCQGVWEARRDPKTKSIHWDGKQVGEVPGRGRMAGIDRKWKPSAGAAGAAAIYSEWGEWEAVASEMNLEG